MFAFRRSLAYLQAMSFTAADVWVGKTLFQPLIIKLCQLTRQSQFAISRVFWFAAALDGFYHAETSVSSMIWGGMSLFMMVTAATRADDPTRSFTFFRLLGIASLAMDLLKGALTGEWTGCEFWLLVLFAEYASTIRTIPPQDKSEAAPASQVFGR